MSEKNTGVKVLIVIVLIAVGGSFFINQLSTVIGVDFYHFWAVDVVLKVTNTKFNNPYKEGSKDFANVLAYIANHSKDKKLKAVQRYRSFPEFTASPILYTFFSFFPKDYSIALFMFQIIQILLFFSGFFILCYLLKDKKPGFLSLCLSLIIFRFFTPLIHDMLAGNTNIIQFALLILSMFLADYVLTVKREFEKILVSICFFILLNFLIVLKLNILIIAVLLIIYFFVNIDIKTFLISYGASLVFTIFLIFLSCLYFNDSQIWSRWLAFIENKNTLLRPIKYANYSTPVIISHFTGLTVKISTIITMLSLIITGLATPIIYWAIHHKNEGFFKYFNNLFTATFKDIYLVTSLGIVVTFAISPLVWSHYYILMLIPALWLLNKKDYIIFGIIAFVLCSGICDDFMKAIELEKIMVPIMWALSWTVLWIGILKLICKEISFKSDYGD